MSYSIIIVPLSILTLLLLLIIIDYSYLYCSYSPDLLYMLYSLSTVKTNSYFNFCLVTGV